MATITQTAGASASLPEASTLPSRFYAFPESLSPLPQSLKRGLLAPGTFGVLSAACCIGMLMFIIYRFLTWRAHYKTFVGYNQYVVLIINLLVADLLQGIAFMFSFHWIYNDGILAPTVKCFSQGFMLNTGDLASGFFVLGIALHTFYGAVKGRHIKHSLFYILVISAWIFAILLSALGPIQHGQHYYVRAGAWCWASQAYENERLAFHYIWIFMVQFGTIIVYLLIFLHLKNTLTTILPASHSTTHARVDRAARLMLLFPIAYIILTMPLSAGRMWTMAHHGKVLPNGYYLAAGSMIGSSGIVDCLLYTFTRRSLVQSNNPSSTSKTVTANDSYDLSRLNGITQTRTVTVTGDRLSLNSSHCRSSDEITDAYSAHSIASSAPPKKWNKAVSIDINRSNRSNSPTGSADRIVAFEGYDPRKAGHKVQISTYDGEIDKESFQSERSESPVNVMKGLAKLARLPSRERK